MEETKLNEREQDRYDIIRSCIDKDITNRDAAVRLGLHIRHVQKIKKAVRKKGKAGVVHESKGKSSHNAMTSGTDKKVTAFFKKKEHRDFGPTFAQEKLAEINIVMSIETIRTFMTKKKLWKPKIRKGSKIHREWRERMPVYGELVQFDGSYHHWFENNKEQCLLAAVDDATSKIISAVFEDNEGVRAVFRFWMSYVETHGRPRAIYLDKFSTYKVNHANAENNKDLMTQFERAMQALDIRVICANSPEAKGRIERLFGTLQDRMVKEMRLARAQTRETANMFLRKTYISDHNSRFSVVAQNVGDAHRPLTNVLQKNLSSIFSIHTIRMVHNDYTIQFKTQWFQLTATQNTTVYRGDKVIIEEHLNNTIHIVKNMVELTYIKLTKQPKVINVKVIALTTQKPTWKPPYDHPWKQGF